MRFGREALTHLANTLHVEQTGADRFTIELISHDGRSFGGQFIGCAARAAGLTCEGRTMHALYATYLRPVPPETPVEVRVDRVRDGRRLARRRVAVCHGGKVACDITVSFTAPGAGADIQDARMPDALPEPEDLASEQEVAQREGWDEWWQSPLHWRWVGVPWRPEPGETSRYYVWVRPAHPLPDDPALYAGTYAYLSDFHSHWPVVRKLGGWESGIDGFVSLDQMVWVHRDARWDDWWLLASECDVAHGGRALSRRTLHARDGRLVATMVQEALIPSPQAHTQPEGG